MKLVRWFKSNQRLLAFFAVLSLPVVFLFKKFGKAGFEGMSSGSVDLNSELTDLADDSAGVPFAYDMTLDQIAYNSCAYDNMPTNQPGMFTIKAGSFNYGGAKLRSDFVSWARSTIKPIYPAETVSDDQVKGFIASNRSLSNAIPQLAIRGRQAPQTLYPLGGSSTASAGVDYVNLLGDLADDRWLATLLAQFNLAPTSGVNFFPLAPGGSRLFEGQLHYNRTNAHRATLINHLSSSYQLALTYRSVSGDLFAARAPSGSDVSHAYGRGYNLKFSQGPSGYQAQSYGNWNVWSGAPINTLTGIDEVSDLRSPAVVNSTVWSCDPYDRFMIVQMEYRNEYCPQEDYSITQNDGNARILLARVRQFLKPEDWDVNLARRCVVPKRATCYKPEQINGSQVRVQYDAALPCYSPGNGQNVVEICPQYVSICTRGQG